MAGFIDAARASSKVNSQVVLVNCARAGADAPRLTDNHVMPKWGNGFYTNCDSLLAAQGLTREQVRVVLYLGANPKPRHPMTAATDCAKWRVPRGPVPDVCLYKLFLGRTARVLKRHYPNVKQMFVHTRTYAGYSLPTVENPEPFAYEYGFATKWIIEDQVRQMRDKVVDPNAGDLAYNVAPWLAWGPYFWASGTTPRSDGLVWVRSDFNAQGMFPSASGLDKVAAIMMNFYLSSPYTTWFRK